MASIGTDPNGFRRILFFAGNGKRKTIRLGRVSMKHATSAKLHVEELIAAQSLRRSVAQDTGKWLGEIDDKLYARIASVGLVRARDRSAGSLKSFLEEYLAASSTKGSTITNYSHTKRCLLEFFGETRDLRDIDTVEAERFRQYLKTEGLSECTIARRIGTCRMFFRRAVKWKLIGENPFTDVKAGGQINNARKFFITREMADAVNDACPNAEWRLLFALSRYGGLRCPSEHLALKWADVDWEKRRIRVTSSKTEHHEGGGERTIPLFPELHQPLLDVFELAEDGAEYVITTYRDATANLRTRFKKIIKQAGLSPWPRLFHNLRGSRETELAEKFPLHVVCAWIGNTPKVAQEHYLQVLDSHFAGANPEPEEKAARKAAHRG
ncbi:MAG TPA: site-specific integrase, partial [Tepidisphaeraceae bacterium]